ncbi:MAG: hypothetical protein ACXWLG_11725 [Myxococcaceae bacterium]
MLVVGAVWLLGRLVPVLVAIACALMLAGTLAPMVRWLEARKIRRGLALAAVFFGALACSRWSSWSPRRRCGARR